MGGFVLYDGTKPLQVLAADDIGNLYETGKIDFPKVSVDEIQDRSKADALSKTLVVVQTIWFITQCIARRVQGLVITELELVTVAFAFLNALMYFLWWNKPLDVHVPIPVYLLGPKEKCSIRAGEDQASRNGSDREMDSESDTSQSEYDEDDNDDQAYGKLRQGCGRTIKLSSATIKSIFVTTYKVLKEILKTFGVMFFILVYAPVAFFTLIFERMAEMTLQSNDISLDQVNLRVPTFYSSEITIGRAENQIVCASSFMAILFGGIHCVGWTFAFRSHVEQLLWQISSATITIIPFCMLVPSAIYILQRNTYPLLMEVVDKQWGLLGLILLLLPLPFYIGARFILLIEACMELRSLSLGALASVVWTNFVPHI